MTFHQFRIAFHFALKDLAWETGDDSGKPIYCPNSHVMDCANKVFKKEKNPRR